MRPNRFYAIVTSRAIWSRISEHSTHLKTRAQPLNQRAPAKLIHSENLMTALNWDCGGTSDTPKDELQALGSSSPDAHHGWDEDQ